jgi:DNA-binding LacI/PurR family transcriptional regulator
VDGLLYVVFGSQIKSFSDNEAKKLSAAKVPFVVLHGISKLAMNFNNVGFNEYQALYQGTEYLIKQGHTDILFLSRDLGTTMPFIESKNGFGQALNDNGITNHRTLIFQDGGFTDGCQQLRKLKAQGALPTAIISYNDFYALSTIRCLEEMGVRVPDDVGLVAGGEIYSDEGMQKALMGKSLTVVRQPVMERGKRAVELLIDMIENPEAHKKPETILFEPELIRRETA